MTAKNLGTIPAPGALTDADHDAAGALAGGVRHGRRAAGPQSRQKAAIGEVMRVVGEANKYLSDMEPWKLQERRPGPDGQRAAHRPAGRRRRQDAAHAVPAGLVRRRCTRCSAGRASGRRCPSWSRSTRRPPSAPVLPGADRRLPDRRPRWESVPLPVGRADGRAHAGVHQARPVHRRRGARAAAPPKRADAGEETDDSAPPAPRAAARPGVRRPHPPRRMAERAGVEPDREFVAAAMAQARAVGVTRVITVGDSVASSRWCVDAAANHPDVYAAVAVHPTEVDGMSDADYAELEALAGAPEGGRHRRDRARLLLGPRRRRGPSRSTSAATSTWPSAPARR